MTLLAQSVPWQPATAHASDQLSVRIVPMQAGGGAIAAAWDALALRSGSPMQEFDWFRACVTAFGIEDLHVLVVGGPAHVAAIAPLARKRTGVDRLEVVGDETYEPMDFIYDGYPGLAMAVQALARTRLPLILKRMPIESPVIESVEQAYRWRGVVITRATSGCPWIPLDRDWLQPESCLPSGRRSDLRRALRIAEKMGTVRCEILSPTLADVNVWLDEAFRVEAAGWKGHEGSALACDDRRAMFYRQYAIAAARKGTLRLCFLRIGGEAAAMQLAVEQGQRFWLLKIGYDERFSRCSPGTLLIAETIRYAAGHGLQSYEFLGSVEPWTRMWTKQERRCVSLRAYPAAGRGVALLATDAVALARRRLGRMTQVFHE